MRAIVHELKYGLDPYTVYWINTFNMCKELGCLPLGGGWLDQDQETQEMFSTIASAYAFKQKQ